MSPRPLGEPVATSDPMDEGQGVSARPLGEPVATTDPMDEGEGLPARPLGEPPHETDGQRNESGNDDYREYNDYGEDQPGSGIPPGG